MVHFSLMQGLKKFQKYLPNVDFIKSDLCTLLGAYVIEEEALIDGQGGLIFLFIAWKNGEEG